MNLDTQKHVRRFILDGVGTIFCVTLVTHTCHGIKTSRTKLVYCVFLFFVFSANFCMNSVGSLGNYTDTLYRNVIKELSLWAMLNSQMLSPIVQLIANIATEKIVIKCIETFAQINDELSFLGYQMNFNDVQTAWKVFTLATAGLGFVIVVDILIVLNMPIESTPLLALKMHLLYMVCAAFDLTNQVYQIKVLHYYAQVALFLKQALQDKLHGGNKKANHENLRHIRKVFVLLSNGCELFNRKYSIFLLFTCLKTIITVAPCLCTVLVERFVRIYVSNDFKTIYSNLQYSLDVLSLLWLTYQLIYILFVINVFDYVTEKVNEVSTVIHDLISTEQVDDISDQLFSFSIEILHTDFHFNVFGFFKIDFTLIFMVLSSISSYTVYLIQFQVTSSSLSSSEFRSQSNFTTP